jgi:enoyl-CoA hydratase
MAGPLTLTVDDGLATLRLSRERGNAINGTLVDELISACQQVDAAGDVRGVLLAASGKLFCPGLDLVELSQFDRRAMEHFLHRFNACVLGLFTLSKPMVAAIHGPAIAGGCVLALTADWRILVRGAVVGLNELRAGVPFPFGVAMILRQAIPGSRLDEVALFGRNYTDEQALAAGLAHELGEAEGFEARCRSRLAELADRDPQSLAVTKRYLRSQTVERIRAYDSQFTQDFLDCWFSLATRERIRAIVASLRNR